METVTKEVGPTCQHISGKDIVVADTLSQLDVTFTDVSELSPNKQGQICGATLVHLAINELYVIPEPTIEGIAEVFQSQDDVDREEAFPLRYGKKTIEDAALITQDKRYFTYSPQTDNCCMVP